MPPKGRYFKSLIPLADEDELMAHIEKLKNQPAKALGDNHGCPQLFCRADFDGPVKLGCLGTNAKSEQQISRFQ